MIAVNWKYDWYLSNSTGQIAYQLGIFGRLLLGLYAARALPLADLARHRAALKKLLLGGAVAGVLGNSVFVGQVLTDAEGFFLPFLRRFVVESGHLGLTLAYAAGLATLFMTPRWSDRVAALAPLGRMALTAYLLQTAFGIWLFYGFAPGPDLMGRIGPAWLAVIWVAGYAVQVACAHANPVRARRVGLASADLLAGAAAQGPRRCSGRLMLYDIEAGDPWTQILRRRLR